MAGLVPAIPVGKGAAWRTEMAATGGGHDMCIAGKLNPRHATLDIDFYLPAPARPDAVDDLDAARLVQRVHAEARARRGREPRDDRLRVMLGIEPVDAAERQRRAVAARAV